MQQQASNTVQRLQPHFSALLEWGRHRKAVRLLLCEGEGVSCFLTRKGVQVCVRVSCN